MRTTVQPELGDGARPGGTLQAMLRERGLDPKDTGCHGRPRGGCYNLPFRRFTLAGLRNGLGRGKGIASCFSCLWKPGRRPRRGVHPGVPPRESSPAQLLPSPVSSFLSQTHCIKGDAKRLLWLVWGTSLRGPAYADLTSCQQCGPFLTVYGML